MQLLSDSESISTRKVFIEVPCLSGDIEKSIMYARAALTDSLSVGEAPLIQWLLYSQSLTLDIVDHKDRAIILMLEFLWSAAADIIAVYMDFGITQEMRVAIKHAEMLGKNIEYRFIPDWDIV